MERESKSCWNCEFDDFCDWGRMADESICDRYQLDSIDSMPEEVEM